MTFNYVTEPGPINVALFQVTHGLYILTTKAGTRINGQCLDALMQVTNAPPRVVVGVGNKSLTHDMICESGQFCISVLDRGNPACGDIVRRFGFQSGRDVDKFADFEHELNEQGIPYLSDAVAVYSCTVVQEKTVDLGTHSLFVGSVDRAGTRGDGEPLTYNEYRNTLRKQRS
jgi:flavin reductase (DIM6/NTAB) family NADH-FMN oxidoreductase RutF